MTKIGVLDLESFYPSKDRFGLVMALNNMLAAPGFGAWMEGEPLDVGRMLYSPSGKPRLAIVSIAHLSDAERMFFVSLLLNQVVGWMRQQSGTTSLRAILYMDEIFGYFPPTANPPSKQPLLTLLKQARAFGLGVVLATQNPVDLDYKGLSNAGTWFIGRLQTDRDKQRVLDGLEGAAVSGQRRVRPAKDGADSGRAGQPRLFDEQHARRRAGDLADALGALVPARAAHAQPDQDADGSDQGRAACAARSVRLRGAGGACRRRPAYRRRVACRTGQRPTVAPEIPQFFVPTRGSAPGGSTVFYRPAIFGAAKVNLADAKTRIDVTQDVAFTTPVTDQAIPVAWENAQADRRARLRSGQVAGRRRAVCRSAGCGGQGQELCRLAKGFGHLAVRHAKDRVVPQPQRQGRLQSGRVRARLSHPLAADARARGVTTRWTSCGRNMRPKSPRCKSASGGRRKPSRAKRRRPIRLKCRRPSRWARRCWARSWDARAVSASTLGRATTAARGVSRSMKESQDIGRAEDNVEALQQKLADLNAEFEAQVAELQSSVDPLKEELETITIKPKKTNISVQLCALVWAPYWRDAQGTLTPAWE